jgi:hypothetical protein
MDIKEKLIEIIDKISELKDLSERSNKSRRDTSTLFIHKGIEDGILDNIHKASKEQLVRFLRDYRFSYYTEYNDDKQLLQSEINKRLRDNKLKQILND